MGRFGSFLRRGQPLGKRRRASRQGSTRQRPHVPRARQPHRLLRRRAGPHGRRWRQGRAPGDVRRPRSPSTRTTRSLARAPRSRARVFDTAQPLYTHIATLNALRSEYPRFATGAQITRYADEDVFAFSRFDRDERREFVVALNSSDAPATVSVPTWGGAFSLIYGAGEESVAASDDGTVTVTVPRLRRPRLQGRRHPRWHRSSPGLATGSTGVGRRRGPPRGNRGRHRGLLCGSELLGEERGRRMDLHRHRRQRPLSRLRRRQRHRPWYVVEYLAIAVGRRGPRPHERNRGRGGAGAVGHARDASAGRPARRDSQ